MQQKRVFMIRESGSVRLRRYCIWITHPRSETEPTISEQDDRQSCGCARPGQGCAARAAPHQRRWCRHEQRRNLTDPDSRIIRPRTGFGQCYNAQTVTEDYLIVAVDVSSDGVDTHQFQPMVTAVEAMIEKLNTTNSRPGRPGPWLPMLGTQHRQPTAPGPDRVIATGSRRTLTTACDIEPPPPLPENATPIEAMTHRHAQHWKCALSTNDEARSSNPSTLTSKTNAHYAE